MSIYLRIGDRIPQLGKEIQEDYQLRTPTASTSKHEGVRKTKIWYQQGVGIQCHRKSVCFFCVSMVSADEDGISIVRRVREGLRRKRLPPVCVFATDVLKTLLKFRFTRFFACFA